MIALRLRKHSAISDHLLSLLAHGTGLCITLIESSYVVFIFELFMRAAPQNGVLEPGSRAQ